MGLTFFELEKSKEEELDFFFFFFFGFLGRELSAVLDIFEFEILVEI